MPRRVSAGVSTPVFSVELTFVDPRSACIAYHPSLVSIPADFVSLSAPIYVGLGALDMLIPENKVPAMRQALIKELGEDKVMASVFPNMIHGFVMRGDSGDKEEREAMERATEEGIQWAERWVGGK
jgi:dienelactone hydrolase